MTCQISSFHTISALSWFLTGDDSDYAYVPAATCVANTLPLFFWEEEAGSRNPYWAAKALTMISGWTRGWSGESKKGANRPHEQTCGGGELIRRLCPWGGRSLVGGDAFSRGGTTAENEPWAQFFNTSLRFKTKLVQHAPAMMTRSLSLFTVAIETGIGSLYTGKDCDSPSMVGKLDS